jgi:hypothetical protein
MHSTGCKLGHSHLFRRLPGEYTLAILCRIYREGSARSGKFEGM